jgi:fimbrial isopeptide formation D2 family protein/uncharacterized repeat protein (TIGR01451 family)
MSAMKFYPKTLLALVGSPSQFSRAVVGLALVMGAIGAGVQPVQAEGSRELVENGGHRPYTEWRTNTTGGILRRTLLKVYVKAGEVINFGSSAVGVGSGNAVLFLPNANVDTATPTVDCKANQAIAGNGATYGLMSSRAQEIAGPLPTAGGYKPCTYTAPADGIYQVAFYGPDGKNGSTDTNSPPANATESIDLPDVSVGVPHPMFGLNQKSSVSMWDITVRSSATSTADISGRVFTDYVALLMGGNSRQLKSDLYVLTDDGYRYQTALNGLDPNGFIFFANAQGLLQPNGQPLYHSGIANPATDNTVSALAGAATIQPPVHKMFFSSPNNSAVTALGAPLTAIAPAPAQNFVFTGGTGGSGNQTPQAVGGNFSFDAPQDGNYQIVIDTNNDGFYNSSDRILEGLTATGFNTVAWDGKDGAGVDLPPRTSNNPYNARIVLKGGEYHFPLIDAETNTTGFTIRMLNPPGGVSTFSNGASPTTIYYDERDYSIGGTAVTLGCASPTSPCDARLGTESSAGGHKFGSNYGDKKAIDTWIFFPSEATFTPLVITTTNKADVKAKKSVNFLTDADGSNTVTIGDQVRYTITYTNLSPATSNATGFVISDTLPPQLIFVGAQITSQTAGNTIALKPGYSGTGDLTNSGTLRVGDSITITITARINDANGGTPISNQASAKFGTAENPATIATVITDADSSGSTTDTPTIGNPFQQIANDGVNLGNDPSNKGDDEPTLFKVVAPSSRLRLVKRITQINATPITSVIDPTTTLDPNDNAPNWGAGYLRGAIGGTVQPGDTIEYTIYFLSDGGVSAQNVSICDLVPTNSAFVPDGFATGSGISLAIGAAAPTFLTNLLDGDQGRLIAASTATPVPCSGSSTANPNGAVLVNIAPNVPAFSVDPNNSYGFIRFRAKVN